MFATPAARELVWQEWEDVFTVYQPSSAETHVFNETTAAVLHCLEKRPATMETLAQRVLETLDIGPSELNIDELAFALRRLEALGLIARADGPMPAG